MKNKLIPYSQLSLSMMIVGSSVVAGKILTTSFPVFLVSGISLFVASVAFMIQTIKNQQNLFNLPKKDYLIIFLQGFLGVFLYRILLFYGLRLTSAAETGIITGTSPAIFGILSFLLLKEKLRFNKISGIAFSVIGIIVINLLVSQKTDTKHLNMIIGNLLIIASVVCESLFSVISKFLSKKSTPFVISALVTLFSFLLFLPISVYEGLNFNFLQVSQIDCLLIVYYGLFVTYISYQLWFKGLIHVEASTAGVFSGLIPVSGVILSYLFLKENLEVAHLIGIFCVLASIIIISKTEKVK